MVHTFPRRSGVPAARKCYGGTSAKPTGRTARQPSRPTRDCVMQRGLSVPPPRRRPMRNKAPVDFWHRQTPQRRPPSDSAHRRNSARNAKSSRSRVVVRCRPPWASDQLCRPTTPTKRCRLIKGPATATPARRIRTLAWRPACQCWAVRRIVRAIPAAAASALVHQAQVATEERGTAGAVEQPKRREGYRAAFQTEPPGPCR